MDFYAVQRPVGKIIDIPELRDEYINVFDIKDKSMLARFGLLFSEHLISITGFMVNKEINDALYAVREWIDGNVNYQKARTLAGAVNDLARNEPDRIKAKFYRTMAQIACIPHVKYHALWATDYAVFLINMMFPGDIDAVMKERRAQIELLKCIL